MKETFPAYLSSYSMNPKDFASLLAYLQRSHDEETAGRLAHHISVCHRCQKTLRYF